ncbi:hypothetical protein PG999_003404 [Apiospora kogelbergensis]|uniref:Uncharacterized protein n=1 Tax=Apiospora kogelbergensis TaxID=1337665 RepID=A0AAW0R3K9_9PEZI
MALLNPTFIFGVLVLLYIASFVLFAVLRIVTGISIQRIGYFSLRRLAYTPKDGIKIEIRGLGLNVHRPTFSQPTWLSIVVNELVVTVDIKELEGHKGSEDIDAKNDGDGGKITTPRAKPPAPRNPLPRRTTFGAARSETWKQLTRIKERIKKLHRNIHWLRMVDVVATDSAVNVLDVGNIQCGSFTVAVDTRRKMVDRARFFFQSRTASNLQKQQAEWIFTLRSVLFQAHGGEASEVLDNAVLNIHGFLYENLDGLRDAAIALKLGRVHIPYDDVIVATERYQRLKRIYSKDYHTVESMEVSVDKVIQELDHPGSTDQDIMQAVTDSKEFVSSILRGIKEVQFAVSLVGLTKKIETVKTSGSPLVMNASMKEVGVDLHRLDPKSPAHRMYFPSKDIAHEALLAALSISLGLDDGQGKPERILYIPMATTTVKTTLPSKTVELTDEGSAEEKNANILFANSVVTSPSVDLDPKHLPVLLALLRPKAKAPKTKAQERHMLISRLLPKANVKFTMHEPVIRIALPPVQATDDPDDFDLIVSSISSISLDLESFHSALEDQHYSLVSQMRLQTHHLYYQTTQGNRFDLVDTEFFDLKVTLGANPDVHVMATGHVQSLAVRMIRPEITNGVRQIIRQLRLDVEPDKRSRSKPPGSHGGIRALPQWLLHFQIGVEDFSIEVAGIDDDFPNNTRGIALQFDSWSAEYRAQRLDAHLRQRPTSRRRAASRAVVPDPEILNSIQSPTSPRKKLPEYYTEGDGRKLTLNIRGMEAFIIDNAEKWEVDPFIHMPRFEIALSTTSDKHGPILHVHCHLRTLLIQYSLYRYYSVGVAVMVLRKAFMRTKTDMNDSRARQHHKPHTPSIELLSPPIKSPDSPGTDQMDSSSPRFVKELVTVDVKASLIQIKADLPADPPVMLQIYSVEAGRHRWAPPFFYAKLIRFYAEAPRMRGVWARIASIKSARMDCRESRRVSAYGGYQDDKMFDIVTEAMRLAVPHEMIIHKISDNIMNVIKATQQLHHRFKTGTNEYILEKAPEGPKNVPKVSLRTRTLLFELEDGAFEWKLGMIYRAGRVEQMQRLAREEAYRVKVKKIQEEESRKGTSGRARNRSAMTRGRTANPSTQDTRSKSEDTRPRTAIDGRPEGANDYARHRTPRYDPDGILGFSGNAHVSIQEARHRLDEHNAQSWKRRIDRHYAMAKAGMRDLRGLFWGSDNMPDDMEDNERILDVPQRPALMSAVVTDLHFMVDKPSFPLSQLPDFLHKVGKGMPKDMTYSLLVPMSVHISMSEIKMSLRDYPLPLLHVPAIKVGQSSRLPALSLKTDFVIAEEFRGNDSTRRIKTGQASNGSFAIDVRRTVGPVKSYSDMHVDINTAYPTRITWGPSYQHAIQDMMMVIESFTKPQLDLSEKVGFWDKIRLNFHSRVCVAWKGDGDVHLALKGTRDPYQVTGNGAGLLMCWRNDVRWNVHSDDDPKRFMTVDSGEYVLAIPDYSHQVREAARKDDENDSMSSNDSYKSGAAFKKVVMKLSGKVQWMAGLVFERAIEEGSRSFEFIPHYNVVLKSPQHGNPDDSIPYDAFRGFRSQHIHLSIAVRAPVDRDWMSSESQTSRSYNTVHLTPRFFTHFFAWWSLFGGPMSLPVRQGALWPGREKNSKKFGRHLATIKYNLLLAPLFLSHIYKHKDAEDYTESSVSATGIKVRFDSFMLDMHQRREEFNTRDRGRKTQTRTTGMKIHAAQLDLVSADVRAVSASIKGTTTEAIKKNSLSSIMAQGEEDGADLSHFTIPDNDFSWIDMDDFVELDWILPAEPNPDTKILPLAYAPRVTYFRQTDIGGTIAGDPDRTSPFGHEPTHLCIMSHDDDPRRVQSQLIRERLDQLAVQIEDNIRMVGEKELNLIRTNNEDPELRAEFETFSQHTGVLQEKKAFLENMLRQMSVVTPGNSFDRSSGGDSAGPDGAPENDAEATGTAPELKGSKGAEFASDFTNRFVIHNAQVKWNNLLRNIILRYSHQVSQRRGFVYYLSRPAVKFILDIVEEQVKAKGGGGKSGANGPATDRDDASTTSKPSSGQARDVNEDIEHRIKQILQDGRKFVNADDDGDRSTPNVPMEDITSGISDDFAPQNTYHVRLIAPQIQLQSEKNKKHVVLLTGKGMELKVVEVMEKARLFDTVSGLVQRRFLVGMDSTQFFVTHQKWFSTQLLALYSGNTYGTPAGTSWPPWVPMEMMHDFSADPFGFKRVVQKTSAMLRYDKYNALRLKYNEDVNSGEGANNDDPENNESRLDNLWVEFPQARALCNSSQYYAIYVIVLDLLMYNEPLEKTRNERLEKIMLASDFSDLRGTPEMVIRLQERIRQLEDIKSHFQIHSKYLDKKGWEDRLLLERDLTACEDELFFMMKAITTSQQKYDTTSQSNALLRWSISAREIVWQLVRDNSEPLVELQLRDVEYDRTDNSDGSHINLFQVGKILGLNLLPDAMYPEMIAPYFDSDKIDIGDFQNQQMIRVYWHMLESIAGIPVMDHFEVNLFPMKIQLEREVGKKLFDYVFPNMDGDGQGANGDNDNNGTGAGTGSGSGKTESPFQLKQNINDADDDAGDETMSVFNRPGSSRSSKDPTFDTRAGSLELRLRPTLTSDTRTPEASPAKPKALSVHTGAGDGGSVFRLFGGKTLNKKSSLESLSSSQTQRPGIMRTPTFASSLASSQPDNKKGTRFKLGGNKTAFVEEKPSDDLSKMMDRASNYMTFVYIKLPSVVLCLSYKGKGERNIEDVHDFVFRLPTIEYRNKTWSNLDLAMAFKSRVMKALISHTGAIIGNKFSRHRPNTAQQSKLRELATSSALLATPALSNSGDNSDDSSSLFGTSPVDYSRSPPRSLRDSGTSGTSIPLPHRSDSRSSSVASSSRHSYRPATSSAVSQLGSEQRTGRVPTFLMMTPPTPNDPVGLGLGLGPAMDEDGIEPLSARNSTLRPSTSGGTLEVHDGRNNRRQSTGGGGATSGPGYLRGKLNALTTRLKESRDSSSSTTGGLTRQTTNSNNSNTNTNSASSQQDEEDYDEAEQEIEAAEIPQGGRERKMTWSGRMKTG